MLRSQNVSCVFVIIPKVAATLIKTEQEGAGVLFLKKREYSKEKLVSFPISSSGSVSKVLQHRDGTKTSFVNMMKNLFYDLTSHR